MTTLLQTLQGIKDLALAGAVKLSFQAHYPQLKTKLAAQVASEAELEISLPPSKRRSPIGSR